MESPLTGPDMVVVWLKDTEMMQVHARTERALQHSNGIRTVPMPRTWLPQFVEYAMGLGLRVGIMPQAED